MDLSKLETLRDKMVKAKDFSEVVHYFMDHFGENRDFIALGKAGRSHVVETGLVKLLNQALHREVRFVSMMLMATPGTDFSHGSFMADKGFGMFFYFKDNSMGMVAAQFPELNGQTLFARFTAMPLPKGSDPRAN